MRCRWAAWALWWLIVPMPAGASFINYSSREINVKVVYYGSGTAGLAENLQYIYAKTNPEAKGKLISLATETERTLFFDFLPLSLGEIRGFKTRFHLYTVPGQVFYEASRKLILKGVDGVVFVADGDPARLEATLESWESLKRNLEEQGYAFDRIPLVVQLDVRQAPKPISVDELRRALGLPADTVLYVANPVSGEGVFDTLKAIAKKILLELKAGSERAPVAEPPLPQAPRQVATPDIAARPRRPCGAYRAADAYGCEVSRERAQERIRSSAFARQSDWLDLRLLPTVWLAPVPTELASLAPGASRLSGAPDLPPGFSWPRYRGRPLTFLAQLDLAALSTYDASHLLPSKGWLAVFCEVEEQDWDGEADQACRLVYFDGPARRLRRAGAPKDGESSAWSTQACRVRPASGLSLPDPGEEPEEMPLGLEGPRLAQYLVLREDVSGRPPDSGSAHRLLGHADVVQGDMRAECLARRSGQGRGPRRTERELAEAAREWVLVLQLDSDDACGGMFGDDGMLYFWMTKKDLAARAFGRACAVMQGY